jgi:hypothetical protein
MNPSLWEKHGEIPRRGQSPVAGLAAELASCPHGIDGRPAPDSGAVLPDVHADRHAVSIGQLQRLSCELFALGRVALLVQQLEIPAAVRSAVNPRDDVIDRGAARRARQVIPAPRAAPVLRLYQFRHECQAVRCRRRHLVVILAITGQGAKRPAAEPLPGRHRQPAHTAPAKLRRHEVKLTGRSDITAVGRVTIIGGQVTEVHGLHPARADARGQRGTSAQPRIGGTRSAGSIRPGWEAGGQLRRGEGAAHLGSLVAGPARMLPAMRAPLIAMPSEPPT